MVYQFLFILSKNQLLALFIFAMVSFDSFAFISALIFKISFLLVTLGFSISSFFSCFRCRVRLFIWLFLFLEVCLYCYDLSPSVQFSSVAYLCPTLCDPMNRSTPDLPVHHQLPEFTQIHVHRVSDAIQPSHSRSSPSPPAPNPCQHQTLFQWVSSSHKVAKVLEFQL